MADLDIREATVDDSALILKFVTELAIYEKAENEVVATVSAIENTLFADDSTAWALICCVHDEPIGLAVYFLNYSTWLGRRGLYLEDLYVSPAHRGIGAGKALMKYLAKIAMTKNCGRFEWNVLNWNQPAIQLYESIGAKSQQDWVGYRLAGKSLEDFASG